MVTWNFLFSFFYKTNLKKKYFLTIHRCSVKDKLTARWPSPCISFSFATCPLCHSDIKHPWLKPVLRDIESLKKKVTKSGKWSIEFLFLCFFFHFCFHFFVFFVSVSFLCFFFFFFILF